MKTIYKEKRIRRNVSQSIVSGVCAGIANYLEVDAVWIRGGALLALFMMPVITLFAYIAGVFLLPR